MTAPLLAGNKRMTDFLAGPSIGVPRRVWLALPLEDRYHTPAADLYRRQARRPPHRLSPPLTVCTCTHDALLLSARRSSMCRFTRMLGSGCAARPRPRASRARAALGAATWRAS
eukprot:1455224-Prymnesium_polylepis.1